MTDVMERTEDIYEVVVRLIKENQIDEAVEKIARIEDEAKKISLLSTLSRDLTLNLARASDLAFALARDLDFARDRALNLALYITSALDRASDRDRDFARNLSLFLILDRDRDLDFALARASDLAFALASDLDRASDLDLTRARTFTFDVASALDRARKFNPVILGVLKRDSIEAPFRVQSITLQGITILTPQSLSAQVTPYLQALFDLQAIIDRLNGKRPNTLKITSISQNSPVEISFDGISDAIETVSTIVMPSRRQNAKKQAELEIVEKELQIAQGQTELKAREAEIRQGKKLSEVELEQKKLEVERARIENEEKLLALEKMRLEIHQQKINMALTILNQLSPELPETQRITYIIQLIQPLGVLMTSPLEIDTK